MKDKKHIDRLFQEKFKNFEASPGEHVWKHISASQENKRKKTIVIPFWYRLAGIASVIVVVSTLTTYWLNTDKPDINTFVTTPQSENTSSPAVVMDNENKNTREINTPIFNTSDQKTEKKYNHNSDIVNAGNLRKNTEDIQNSIKTDNSKLPVNSPKKAIAKLHNKDFNIGNESNQTSIAFKKTSTDPFSNSPDESDKKVTSKDGTVESTPLAQQIKPSPNEKLKEERHKKSLFDAIKTEEEALITEKRVPNKKWNITPNVAPVYYSSIGNGSSIDPQFKDNNKDGQINMSYGIQIAYALNKKVKVRSGINKVDLSYNTEGVGFGPSIVSRELQSVTYNTIAEEIEITDYKSPNRVASDVNGNFINKRQTIGFLNQRLNYIEVPLEIEYALISNKLAVQMIGGLSTLFLSDNEISVQSSGLESSIGEANNLNDISFSGNIGLGIDYSISESFQINMEPIFKYQLNAFSKNDGNFKPYYFGIYTGVNFKF
ncbi:hypothetical protein ACE939_12705 [Aquimarina sp. W85]|uniref:hypothetical protein n=1 Tax=Aquimarina rhodophyticola TaxID=3342246 RepID=UPI003671487E